MNDAQIRDALLLIEERPVPAEFTDRVFAAMSAALEAEAARPARPAFLLHRRQLPRLDRVRPARLVLAAAAVVALIATAVVLLSVPKPPSALALLQDARQRFEQLPAYHARTAVAANENAGDADFETTWETEDWYQDSRHWRTTFGSSTSTTAATGDVWVMSPDLFAEYDASTNVFAVRPSAEGPMQDPSFFFDPNLQWWGTGTPGEGAKPSDEFFEEDCTATEGQFIGREATKLICEAAPRDLELWLDDETGMLLRVSAFDIVREITSIEFEPDFPDGIFAVTPPEGAKLRWRGSGAPPPEYAVPIGTDVAARHQLVDRPTDGLTIVELAERDLWVLVTRCDRPSGMACGTELLRVDARTGGVLATLLPPEGFGFGDVSASEAGVWVQLASVSAQSPATPPAFVQRIDPERNLLVGRPIETGTDSGGLAQIEGALWSASGRHREVEVGRAESFYHSLARIDAETGAVTQFDLGTDAMGVQAVGGSLWVATSAIDMQDPERTVYELVEFDPRSQQAGRRVVIPGWPNSTTTDGERLYTLFADEVLQWHLGVVDITTGALTTAPIGSPGTEVTGMAVAAGHAWIGSLTDDAVLKVDLSTLQVTGSVATGRQPASVRFGNGSIWVTHPAEGTLARIDVE